MSRKKISTLLLAVGVTLALLLLPAVSGCANKALTMSTTSLPNGEVGFAYSQTLAATGGKTPYTWSISSGALPNGLSLASSTGAITGTPTTAGTSNFTVKVTDSTGGTATANLSITIILAPTSVSTTSLPDGEIGFAYSHSLAATGGTSPYSWALTSGALPNGLSLTSSSGVISGTPTETGTWNFTVMVTDSIGGTATASLSITINAVPAMSTTSLPNGDAGVAYSEAVAVTGGTSPYTWSISSGALPNGLSLASSTGAITGTPTTVGTSSLAVKVTDSAGGTATANLSITINVAPTISTTSLANGISGAPYPLQTLAVTGGTSPYTWSLSSGDLPNGLFLTSSPGVISGTPTGTGTWNFMVKVTDSAGGIAMKNLSITISS